MSIAETVLARNKLRQERHEMMATRTFLATPLTRNMPLLTELGWGFGAHLL
jgi:hypothetical protein